MLVLGIETSTAVTSVALWRRDAPVASLRAARPRGHVEFLMPMIQDACRQGGVTLRDVTAVAVGLGPGLFTSMRVGIATAKTIAHVAKLHVVGVSSLDLLAFAVRHSPRTICACIEARKDEVFAARYRSVPGGVQRVSDYEPWQPDALAADLVARREEVIFVGSGAASHRRQLEAVERAEFSAGWADFPSADALCELAIPKLEREEGVVPAVIEPIYVRKTTAEINWEQRGVRIERPSRIKVPKRAAEAAGGVS